MKWLKRLVNLFSPLKTKQVSNLHNHDFIKIHKKIFNSISQFIFIYMYAIFGVLIEKNTVEYSSVALCLEVLKGKGRFTNNFVGIEFLKRRKSKILNIFRVRASKLKNHTKNYVTFSLRKIARFVIPYLLFKFYRQQYL